MMYDFVEKAHLERSREIAAARVMSLTPAGLCRQVKR
jgi:hypothetical protein